MKKNFKRRLLARLLVFAMLAGTLQTDVFLVTAGAEEIVDILDAGEGSDFVSAEDTDDILSLDDEGVSEPEEAIGTETDDIIGEPLQSDALEEQPVIEKEKSVVPESVDTPEEPVGKAFSGEYEGYQAGSATDKEQEGEGDTGSEEPFVSANDILKEDYTAPEELKTLSKNGIADPLGGGDDPVLMSEHNELAVIATGGGLNDVAVLDGLDINVTDNINGEGYYVNNINVNHAAKTDYLDKSVYSTLKCVQSIGFDAEGTNRKDYIASVGIDSLDQLQLVIQNAADGKSQSYTIDYVSEAVKTRQWTVDNFLSITAGDYDGDGKDTVVIYLCGNGKNVKIREYYPQSSEVSVEGWKGRDVLNLSKVLYGRKYETDTDYNYKPSVTLATGDFNGDGRDQIAFSAGYFNTSNDKKSGYENFGCDNVEQFSTCVEVVDWDDSKNEWAPQAPVWMYEIGPKALYSVDNGDVHALNIMHAGAIAAGDVNGDYRDEIVVAGYMSHHTPDQPGDNDAQVILNGSKHVVEVNNVYDFDDSNFLGAVISYDDTNKTYVKSSMTPFAMSDVQQSTFSSYCDDKDWVFTKLSMACAGINGDRNPDAVFICGYIYDCSDGFKPEPVYKPYYLSSTTYKTHTADKDKAPSVDWIRNVTAGNFNGNNLGREQFVFSFWMKHKDKNTYNSMLGVIAGASYGDNYENGELVSVGNEIGYANNLKTPDSRDIHTDIFKEHIGGGDDGAWVHSSHFDGSLIDDCMNAVPVAVDVDDDGVIGKYRQCGYVYTDPVVLAVLEAAPYYEEIEEAGGYGAESSTAVEMGSGKGDENTHGHTVELEAGYAGDFETPGMKVEFEIGGTTELAYKYTETITQTTSLKHEAGTKDIVVVQRVPVLVYTYDVLKDRSKIDTKDGWIENGANIRVPLGPRYYKLTVDKYNEFVDEYNALYGDAVDEDGNKLVNKYGLKKIKNKASMLNGGETRLDLPEDHEGNPDKYWDENTAASAGFKSYMDDGVQLGYGGSASEFSREWEKEVLEGGENSHGFHFGIAVKFGSSVEGLGGAYGGGFLNVDYKYSYGHSDITIDKEGSSGQIYDINADKVAANTGLSENDVENGYGFKWKFGKWSRQLHMDGESDEVPFYGYVLSDVKRRAMPPQIVLAEDNKPLGYPEYFVTNKKLKSLDNTIFKIEKAEGSDEHINFEEGMIVVSEGMALGPHQATFNVSNGIAEGRFTYKVTVVEGEPTYRVTVNSAGNGKAYPTPVSGKPGTEVTLTAVPDKGFKFKEWQVVEGDVTVDENNKIIIGDSNVAIDAVFEEAGSDFKAEMHDIDFGRACKGEYVYDPRQIYVTNTGNGVLTVDNSSLTIDSFGSDSFNLQKAEFNDPVVLAPGRSVCLGEICPKDSLDSRDDAYEATLTFRDVNGKLEQAVEATVTFGVTEESSAYDSYVNVVADEGGTAAATPTWGHYGTLVELEYTPDDGYEFDRWELVSGSVFYPDASTMDNFGVIDDDKFYIAYNTNIEGGQITIKAHFKKLPTYTVSVEDNIHGTGFASPESGKSGTTVTLHAIPNEGFKLSGWEVISGGITVSNNKFDIGSSDVVVKPAFEAETGLHTYTVSINSAGNGTAYTSIASGETGDEVTLTAEPDDGYWLKEWRVDEGDVEITDNSFAIGTKNVVITAIFEKIQPPEYSVKVYRKGKGTAYAEPAKGPKGTKVNLIAEPDNGYEFKEWQVESGGITIDNNSFTLGSKNVIVTAVFVRSTSETYTVTMTDDGHGTAYATSDKGPTGKEITLTAEPDEGYEFKEWQVVSGGVTVSGNKFTIGTANVEIKALFTEAEHSAVMPDIDFGSVNDGYDFSQHDRRIIHFKNTGKNKLAVVSSNVIIEGGNASDFTHEITYSGDIDPGETVNLGWIVPKNGLSVGTHKATLEFKDSAGKVTASADVKVNITKHSEPIYSVNVVTEGHGRASANPVSGEAGTEVTLTATPDKGYKLKEWKVLTYNVSVSDNKFTLPEANVKVEAVFEALPSYTVTVTNDGNGSASASVASGVTGTEVTLTAAPNEGYRFKEWQVVSGGVTISNNMFTIGSSNVEVKAVFEALPVITYTVTVTNDGNGTGHATPAEGTSGTKVSLISVPNKGYRFKEWQVVAGGVTVTDNKLTIGSANIVVKAVFEKIPEPVYTVNVRSIGGGTAAASVKSGTKGTEVTLAIAPSRGYVFKEWRVVAGGVTIHDNKFFIGTQNVEIEAVFEEVGYDSVMQNIDFGTANKGYSFSDNDRREIYVTNTGTGALNIDKSTCITVSGKDAGSFEYSISYTGALAPGNTASLGWILPKSGLAAGTYTAEMRFKDSDNRAPEEAAVTFTVTDSTTPVYSVNVITDGHGTAAATPTSGTAGTRVSLTSTPDKGYRLKEWKVTPSSVAITGNELTMPAANVKVEAIFEEIPAPVYSVAVTNDGNGTATASPTSGVTGTEVTLTATPNEGFKFKEWQVISGGVSVTDNKFRIGSLDVSIKAIFEKTGYGVVLQDIDFGTVNKDYAFGIEDRRAITITNTGSEPLSINEDNTYLDDLSNSASDFTYEITYNGTLEPGVTAYIGWVLPKSQLSVGEHKTRIVFKDNGYNITTNANVLLYVTANSETKLYSVNAVSYGHGTASASPVFGPAGTKVTLSANPDNGYVFKKWEVVAGNVTVNNGTLIIAESDVKVVAHFVEESLASVFDVTVTNDGHGTATASPASGRTGTEVTLTATPNEGYRFKEWQVLSGGVTVTNNKLKIASSDVAVKAIFELLPEPTYTVTVTDDGNGTGYATPVSGTKGTKVTLISVPKAGFRFKEWQVVSGEVTINNDGTFVIGNKDVIIKAVFETRPPEEYTVTVNSSGGGKATSSVIKGVKGTEVTLTATPNTGYLFKEWRVISGGVNIINDKFKIGTANVVIEAAFEEIKYGSVMPDIDFGTANKGYSFSDNDRREIYLTNTGTGKLGISGSSIQIEGTDADKFYFSYGFSGSIDPGTTVSFGWILPNNDLPAGTYTAVIKFVDKENKAPASAKVTFTVTDSTTPVYSVNVVTDGHGTASATPVSGSKGTKVTLTATPDRGYEFKEWYVLAGGVAIANNRFTFGESNVKVKAIFKEIEIPVPLYSVTVINDGNGTASASLRSGETGKEVTLTANPNKGYKFKEWQVILGGVTITDNKFTIGTSDVKVRAVFYKEGIAAVLQDIDIGTVDKDYDFTQRDSRAILITNTGSEDLTVNKDNTYLEGGTAVNISNETYPAEGAPDPANKPSDFDYAITYNGNIAPGVTAYIGWIIPHDHLGVGIHDTQIVFHDGNNNPMATAVVKFYVIDSPTPLYSVNAASYGNGTASALPVSGPTGTKVTLSAKPDSGYRFDRWQIVSGTVTIDNKYQLSIPGENVNLVAHFEPTEEPIFNVEVLDDGNGKGVASPGGGPSGTDVVLTAVPKDGFKFKEWQPVSGVSAVTGNGLQIGTDDVKVRAVFEAIPTGTTYTVTFDSNGGTGNMASMTVNAGDKLTLPQNGFTAPSGKEFDRWDAGIPGQQISVTRNMTIKALWKDKGSLTVPTYVITFDLNGGTLDGQTGIVTWPEKEGTVITLPRPTRSGYTFNYWRGSRYAAGESYTVTKDHTLTAIWTANGGNSETETYTVTFDSNGHGSAPSSQTVKAGDKALKPSDPSASGYTFGGWYTESSCNNSFDFSTAITRNITLYAKWTSNSSSSSDGGNDILKNSNSSGGSAPNTGNNLGVNPGSGNAGAGRDKVPVTGDSTPIILLVIMLIVSLVSLILALNVKKRKPKQRL